MAPSDTAGLERELSKLRRLTSSAQPHQSKPAHLLLAIESTIASTLPASAAKPPYSATAYFAALLQCLEKACSEVVASSSSSTGKAEAMASGALIPATLYLLAVILPETSAQVISSRSEKLLTSLLGLVDSSLEHPPALRSLLQILATMLRSSPTASLQSSSALQQAFHTLLELSLDHRPKVRHVAQEGVQQVLTTAVSSKATAVGHPYVHRAREWVMEHLQEEVNGGSKQGKKKARAGKGEEDGDGKKIIWLIQGLKGWVSVWGQENLAELCSTLLALPPSAHVTTQIYSLLSQLLSNPRGTATSSLSNLPTILDSLLSSPPDLRSPSSASEMPTYLNALCSALIKLSLQAPDLVPSILPRAFNLVFNQILLSSSDNRDVLEAASDAVGGEGIVRYCLTDDMILAAVRRLGASEQEARKGKVPFLTRLIAALREAMDVNALKMEYLLPILTALVSRLRVRIKTTQPAEIDPEGRGPTAAQLLLGDLVAGVADLRLQKGFQDKEAVDEVVGTSIEVMGVEAVLGLLPLNIEPDASGSTPQPGRAHLLPLIRQRTTNDSFSFFASYFRPLSERVFGRKVAAEDAERGNEAKVWEAIVGQIWDCWPGFCDMPRDLKQGLTPQFLTLITNLLYTQPALLPSLLRGLSQLVNSTLRILSSSSSATELKKQFGVDQTNAQADMTHLRSLAKDMVSVLLNVFSKMPRDSRNMVGDVIGVWTGIMSDSDLLATYSTVTSHLASNLSNTTAVAPGASPISHTMLDLLLIFTPLLPAAQARELFQSTLSPTLLQHRDATVQKKSYRLLKRLIESEKLSLEDTDYAELVATLSGMVGRVGPGAQRDRLQLLSALVEALPSDSLGLLPELLTEAVLGTKEVNERARNAGFELVVVMGQKMARGGTVKQPESKPAGDNENDEEEEEEEEEMKQEMAESVDANIEEYIKMVAAGLTGTTPHMISASINALSRLVFEFQADLSMELLSQLIPTLVLFLSSKNREIVKSALGFTKLIIIALPIPVVQPHLGEIVPGLLGWVHDHKNHFKTKTVHIFERMMRRFGYEEVLALAPRNKDAAGARKVLEGIKKRKEKAAKKRAAGREGDEDDDEGDAPNRTDTGDAFEDILYNSDSSDDSDENGESGQGASSVKSARGAKHQSVQANQARRRDGKPLKSALKKSTSGANGTGTVLRDEGDDPLDLLSRSIASRGASSASFAHRRQPGQEAAKFKLDKEGKMIISEPGLGPGTQGSDDEGGGASAGLAGSGRLGDGGLGMRKNTRGDLKFAGNTRVAREAERQDERGMDIDMDGVARPAVSDVGTKRERAGEKDKRKRNKQIGRLGDEFRAKKAGGDIKRTNGPDPYSYVSLNQASARMGTKGRVNLTNKRKGSRR